MTGGLQEQVVGNMGMNGIGLYPSSKAIIGSQDIPWIYEDRLDGEDVINAMQEMIEMDPEQRKHLGEAGRKHVQENYNFKDFNESWVALVEKLVKEHGSWEDRKKYQNWTLEEMS